MDNLHPIHHRMVSRAERETKQGHLGLVLWLTGLSGSGKSTLALYLERHLFEKGVQVMLLDGDNIRNGINKNLGFSEEDRVENIRRISEVARLFLDAGMVVICAFISPLESIRQQARDIIGSSDFLEVFIDAPLALCEERDVKGLYKKARAGEIKGFTGIDAPFEIPLHPDLRINTASLSPEQAGSFLLDQVNQRIRFDGSSARN